MCEKVLGSLCIALMVFVVHKDATLFSIADGREKLFWWSFFWKEVIKREIKNLLVHMMCMRYDICINMNKKEV